MNSEAQVPAAPVVVGKITGVYGVRGWVKIHSFTEPKQNLLKYQQCLLGRDGRWEAVELDRGHSHGKGLVAHLKGIDDRDRAAQFTGLQIAISEQQLPALAADEYYWHQLEGLAVWAADAASRDGAPLAAPPDGPSGCLLGRVDHLLETGANDVLVVKACKGSIDQRERLIPWLPDTVVSEIDLDAGYLRVDWDPDF